MEPGDLGTERDVLPEARVVGDLTPPLANARHPADLQVREVGEDVQQHLVRQLFDGLGGGETSINKGG